MKYRLKFFPMFAWYDFWVGCYLDLPKQQLYFFPLPMLGVRVAWVLNTPSTAELHAKYRTPKIGEDFCLPGDSYGWDRVRELVCYSPRDGGWIVYGSLVTNHPYVLHSHIVNGAPQWDATEPETTT